MKTSAQNPTFLTIDPAKSPLQTLAAIWQADVIIYDRSISSSLLNEARLDAMLIYNHQHPSLPEIDQLLLPDRKKNSSILYLTAPNPAPATEAGDRSLPLFGTKILLTGTRHITKQLQQVLSPLGTETIALSLVETISQETIQSKFLLNNLAVYSWAVFTSSNAIHHFFTQLKEAQIDFHHLSHIKYAVVGSSCAKTLLQYGFQADFIPDHFSAQTLSECWIPILSEQDRVLLLSASKGCPDIRTALANNQISFDEIHLYKTIIDYRRAEELNRLIDQVDYVVVCSGSAAKALQQMLTGSQTRLQNIISIGPETTKALSRQGFIALRTAASATARGIANVILEDAIQKEKNNRP